MLDVVLLMNRIRKSSFIHSFIQSAGDAWVHSQSSGPLHLSVPRVQSFPCFRCRFIGPAGAKASSASWLSLGFRRRGASPRSYYPLRWVVRLVSSLILVFSIDQISKLLRHFKPKEKEFPPTNSLAQFLLLLLLLNNMRIVVSYRARYSIT